MNAQLSMLNTNPKTGVPYGYISSSALNPDVVHDLMYGSQAVNHTENEVLVDFAANEGFEPTGDNVADYHEAIVWLDENYDGDWIDDVPTADECIVTGTYEGVSYQSSWLGGALNFYIFESPVFTRSGRKASPCVPGACILDTLDGSESGYDVPADWRADYE